VPLPRYLPRWAILLIDTALCLLALLAAYQLRFNFQVPVHEYDLLWPVLPVFLLVRAGSLFAARVHMAQVKHTSTEDARRIFLVVLAGSALFGLLSMARYYLIDGTYFLPRTVIIIDFMATAMLLIASRIAVKLLHLRARGSGKDEVRVLLYGAGAAGLITKRALDRDGAARYTVAAFLDDDAKKAGQRLEGVPIVRADKLVDLLKDGGIDQVIITVQHPDAENRRRVVDAAMAWHTQVLSVPPVHDWINGQLSSGQIREVRIEDLLGRATISLDDTLLKERFSGKCVLVTGAAGSIGSGIARQLITLGAGHTVLLDNAESDLYDLEMELRGLGHVDFTPVIADVRDRTALERVFAARKPAIVFHAAAYKHVPLMESWPEQAILTNVLGTRIVAELGLAHHVEECVLVSTDKAVNPTSVMGATKRCAELFMQALGAATPGMSITTTRFGNVLGSNGSVIPLFRKQIAEGGPVTVTDPEVTRFFMTIPEACRLVLEAATMGKGGEIYVFDMGQPVRIADLADRMIRLSGLEPGKDIAIKYTGLRPGEKLFEELFHGREPAVPTGHDGLLMATPRTADAAIVARAIDEIAAAARAGNIRLALTLLGHQVPEFAHNAAPDAGVARA